ncbi:MAG: hypothetical protein B5M52_04965 [Helicobacteraceae bacterium 4484_230]|nr:MAG: hypothetical protein B5M52_04965 [Helicobacteraceae bacterium 4484_230]
MKYTLLTIIFGLKILFANEYFLLPDNSSDALYALKKRVDSAKNEITLIGSQKLDRQLFSAIRNALKREVKLNIITTSLELASSLAVYKNSHVLLLRTSDPKTLQINLLLIDNKSSCSSGIGFSAAAMSRNSALLECSEERSKITFYRYVIKQIKSRCENYFINEKG